MKALATLVAFGALAYFFGLRQPTYVEEIGLTFFCPAAKQSPNADGDAKLACAVFDATGKIPAWLK